MKATTYGDLGRPHGGKGTRTEALHRIFAAQERIFLSRDKTRGTHDLDTLTCSVMMRDKAVRLINQWREGIELDEEELLDIANYALIGIFLMRDEWRLPWE